MKNKGGQKQIGFTIVEVLIGMVIISILILSATTTYIALQSAAAIARHKSIATELATNRIENLKSMPYDNLAVAGGAIYHPSPLPATETKTINGYTYTVKTSINYIDDAFDGCGNYANETIKQSLCRNYPPPSGSPATDLNPADYKIVNVKVFGYNNKKFAELDTQVAARVAETDSTTGALSVKVMDDSGNPISGATVQLNNNTLSPTLALTDSTDSFGTAIFYGLPPDSDPDYVISASKSGYSSLSTIVSPPTLTASYPNQNIFAQTGSNVTLTLRPMTTNSLAVAAVDTSGNPISGVKINAKGGYKKYTDTSNTEYYYNNFSPADTRPTTDTSGLAYFNNLVPGEYIYCGDDSRTGCNNGVTNYIVAAVVASEGDSSFKPSLVPVFSTSSPLYSGYSQLTRLILTTSSSLPTIKSISPSQIDQANLANLHINIEGTNLTCYSQGNGCPTTVRLKEQGGATYTATNCYDDDNTTGIKMECDVNLAGASNGMKYLEISNGGGTLSIPFWANAKGGVNVVP
ncbi:carboxypeptidase regulatory-like domain-containing protein [Candidatus Saccharibacteria bacterium]|jgi:prepilin-type N-terminal cleavage/methylation domain-containing protein|nr:carboxypeptidase regulatory-like domain-containing protein [Candidatus Saccharibacteria bacterium]MCA9350548.1 carboxypeptidase regulatory-like domain-containing protein [Candidatus Saccharibacteria bacterium]